MRTGLVSVVIPCHDVQDYISECVRSVLAQGPVVREIICVENNSSDQTLEEIEILARSIPSLLIARESKRGAPAARNKGLSLAGGEWIQFLDADDLLQPGKIKAQLEVAETSEMNGARGCDVVAGAYVTRSLSGTEIPARLEGKDPFLAAFTNQCGITSANLWRRSAVIKAGGWNEGLASSQETDLLFRLLLGGSVIAFDHHPGTVIRERGSGQISKQQPADRLKRYIDLRLAFRESLRTLKPAVFAENEMLFNEFLLNSVIRLGAHDATMAAGFYNEHLARTPHSTGNFGISPFKSWLIRRRGLRNFLRIVRTLR